MKCVDWPRWHGWWVSTCLLPCHRYDLTNNCQPIWLILACMICHTWLDFYVGELLPVLPAIRITNQWLVILLFLTPAVPKVLWKFTDGEINFYHIATSTIKVCAIKSTGLVVLNRSSGYCLSDKQTSDHAIVLQIHMTWLGLAYVEFQWHQKQNPSRDTMWTMKPP